MSARYVAVAAIVWIGAAGYPTGAGSDIADAAQRGDRATVRALLQKKLDVNAAQVDGATALHWAIHRLDVELADLLLARGASVSAKTREGVTPLAMAAQHGHGALIARLLAAGADAKELGVNGETMVMFAARAGSADAIKVLVAAGADVNARERLRGTTALMWAAEQRHPDAVTALLELGADPAIRSGGAGVPRNYMAQRVNVRVVNEARERRLRAQAAGRTYEEQVTWEQQNGVAMQGQRGLGTPLGPDGQPLQQGQVQGPPQGQQAAQVQGRGRGRGQGQGQAPAAPTDPDDDSEVVVAGLVGSGGGGLTALIFAAREGDIDSARALVSGGADVNQTSEYGWTPLLTAVNNRNYQLARLLLERGVNPNLANKGGWTPLYLATDNRNIEGGDYPVPKADMDHLELIRLLLERGANANARVRENTLTRTIFTMQWFFEDGATPFVRASQSSDTALMQLLLKHGADPKAATANGDNALTAAAGIGWVEGVTYERSAKENLEAMRMLLDLGLDPNHQNNEGRTALMGAAMKGRSDVVRLLVERGAKLELTDYGSRDTDKLTSAAAGRRWQALDYADGLVRVGVQSAVARPETSALIRRMMEDRGLPVPPADRNILSICVVALCQ